jgi:PmbA protein
MSFVATFVVANLSGPNVVARRSAFALDDFRARRRVMRDDLSLLVDTTLDLESAASPISGEGVPGGVATLVESGRLVRPFADLKYAARSGFPPTPVPGGSPGFLFRTERPLRPVEQIRAEIAAGLELHAVLGMHGQDSASGRYTLVSPAARVLLDGRHVGRAKVSFGGSFFEHLLDDRTALVAYPWDLNPGLLIWTAVERQA